MRISDWSSDVCSSDLAALHRVHPGGGGHVLVDNCVDAGSGVDHQAVDVGGDLRHGGIGGAKIELHVAPEEEVGVEVAEEEVGVGRGRVLAAAPVGGGAGLGAGGVGAHLGPELGRASCRGRVGA